MPSTAAERRTRRLAAASDRRRRGRAVTLTVQRAARRADSDSDGANDSDSHGADDAFDDSDSDDSDSDGDGANDSDSHGADDAFAAEPNEGPGAALADSSSHELSDGDAAACSAAYGSAVLRHCQRALQLLHDGGVRASTAAATAPDARAGPFPLSDLILLARAAACRAAVPQLPTAARVRQACLRAGVQAADVIVDALAGIRKAVNLRNDTDRRRRHSQRANQGLNDVAAALDLHYGTDWSDLLGDAEFLDRTDELAVQQLADKIRAAGHVTAEDAQSCVEDFRVDDDMILKVRDSVSVARRKVLQRGCALMELQCASCVRARALHVHAPHVRAPLPSRYVVRAACETPPKRTPSASSATRLRRGCSCRRDTDTSPAWMLVSPRGLAQLNAEGVVELLDNEGNTVSFHTRLLRHFVEFRGRTYHCHPDAVDLATGACDLCSDCVRVGRPTLGHALTAGRPHPCERLEAYYSWDAPEGSIAAGDDIGTFQALEALDVATDVSQLEVLLLARARAYAIINKVTA